MTANDFLIWEAAPVVGACALGDLRGLQKSYRLNDGTPLAAEFPAGVEMHMSDDSPNNLRLIDSLLNTDMLIVASPRLTSFLQAQSFPHVEYLPIAIVDHKKRKASVDYSIVHPTAPVDAIDKEHSIYEEDLIDKGAIESFEKLALDPVRIPAERRLFRLAGFWNLTIVRRDLAQAIDRERFEGIRWVEIDDYPEA